MDRSRQKTWDAENYTTVACRISRQEAEKLREHLAQFHLTRYTFLRMVCQWAIRGDLDQLLRVMENVFHGTAPRDEVVAELDGIVRGLSHPYIRPQRTRARREEEQKSEK